MAVKSISRDRPSDVAIFLKGHRDIMRYTVGGIGKHGLKERVLLKDGDRFVQRGR